MKKLALYTRVSTKKDEQSKSIEMQREVYTEYCIQKNYELFDVYADKESGTNARRPDFIRLMYDAGLDYVRNEKGYDDFKESKRKPLFDYIICKDVSRFSRSAHLGLTTVEYLRNKGVYVIFENSGLVTDADDWHLRTSILFTIAQNESHNTSRRIRFSKRNNAKKGIYSPARLPYGYVRDELNEKVIDEEQAENVRFIYERFIHEGAHLIAQQLNEKGEVSQQGYRWSGDKVLRVIRNKAYTGNPIVNRYQKENVTDTKFTNAPKSQWIEIPNALPAIVTMEQWTEVNKVREQRINTSSQRGRKPAINDDFYEKVYCANCGSRFVRHQGRNNEKSKVKLSYMCQNRRKNGAKVCGVRSIAFNILDDLLNMVDVSKVQNQMGDIVYSYFLNKRLDEEVLNVQKHVKEIEQQINTLNEENQLILNGIVEQLSGGSQETINLLNGKIANNKKKIDDLNIQKAKMNLDTIFDLKEKVEAKEDLIQQIETNTQLMREDKLKMLKAITVDDYSVSFDFSMPSYLEEVEEFNSIFVQNPIEDIEIDLNSFLSEDMQEQLEENYTLELGFSAHTVTFRREHKEAIDYWAKIDEELDEKGVVSHESGKFFVKKR